MQQIKSRKLILNTGLLTILVSSLFLLTGCDYKKIFSSNKADLAPTVNKTIDQKLSPDEQAFNQSGRAKAIEDETDLWMVYADETAGFSLKYPHDVVLGDSENGDYNLFIEVENINNLEGTMGYNQETALANIAALQQAEYGESVDFPLEVSKQVVNLGQLNAQQFMVLGRFEICDMTFENKLYFFNNNQQVVITLKAPKDFFVAEINNYITIDERNCGPEKIWDFDNNKLEQFYQDLQTNKLSAPVQRWQNIFKEIINSIEFFEVQNKLNYYESLQGSWLSMDDADSKIEFKQNQKIDFYAEQQMSQASFELYQQPLSPVSSGPQPVADNHGQYLIVNQDNDSLSYYISELTDEFLTLTYLARGNTLKYQKIITD